jgi:hypothetical protein
MTANDQHGLGWWLALVCWPAERCRWHARAYIYMIKTNSPCCLNTPPEYPPPPPGGGEALRKSIKIYAV